MLNRSHILGRNCFFLNVHLQKQKISQQTHSLGIQNFQKMKMIFDFLFENETIKVGIHQKKPNHIVFEKIFFYFLSHAKSSRGNATGIHPSRQFLRGNESGFGRGLVSAIGGPAGCLPDFLLRGFLGSYFQCRKTSARGSPFGRNRADWRVIFEDRTFFGRGGAQGLWKRTLEIVFHFS